MSSMRPTTFQAFIDTNVPIYAAGAPHALKEPCVRVLALAAARPRSFVTDAEVLQELLHRYLALGRWNEGSAVFSAFLVIMAGRVEAIAARDVTDAAEMVDRYRGLSARDLVHVAVVRRLGVDHVVSADRAFDAVDGVNRLDPAAVDSWADLVSR